jgi:hypothetical protein
LRRYTLHAIQIFNRYSKALLANVVPTLQALVNKVVAVCVRFLLRLALEALFPDGLIGGVHLVSAGNVEGV